MPTFQFKHIANRLLFWILGVCLLIFIGFSSLLYQQASALLRLQAESSAELAVKNVVQDIESLMGFVSHSVRAARSVLLNAEGDEQQLTTLLETLVNDNADVYGMALALQPNTFPGKNRFARYVYRHDQGVLHADLSGDTYDYLQQPWYRDAINVGRSVWSEPYFDQGGGNVAMVTYSSPIVATHVDGTAHILGIITADISLQTLAEKVSNVPLGSRGYGYILSAAGHIITHNQPGLRMAKIEQLPSWRQRGPEWHNVIEAMTAGQHGNALLPCADKPYEQCWLAYAPLQDSTWSILVVIPLADMETGVLGFARLMQALGAGAIALLTLLILALSRHLTRPINTLANHTALIARGDLQTPAPTFRLEDEVGQLANSIGTMQADLQQHITDLTEASARRQRMQSELAIAATIQAQMLPDGGHSRIIQHSCELVAAIQPAREIGGDLYLYQILDAEHLFFFLGDVSDKGIPAALFMAQCIAQIRELLGSCNSPGHFMQYLNQRLARHNDNCMFVTAIAGVVNCHSGRCLLANAGHPAPLLVGDECSALQIEAGPALGLMDDPTYLETTIDLATGQTLLLYTDGVDEAMNETAEALGQDGLIRAVASLADTTDQTLVDRLMQFVMEYQHDQPFDDTTLLSIHMGAP